MGTPCLVIPTGVMKPLHQGGVEKTGKRLPTVGSNKAVEVEAEVGTKAGIENGEAGAEEELAIKVTAVAKAGVEVGKEDRGIG